MIQGKLGVWSLINSYEVLRVLLGSEIDFVVFDLEHGNWRRDQLAIANQMCRGAQKYSVLRIPSATQETMQLAQDSLSDFVQISGIRSQTDIDKISMLTAYPPLGTLGYSPWTSYGIKYTNNVGFYPKISLQFEELAVLRSLIEGNLKLPQQTNSIFIGRYDLSVSMGFPGDISNPILIQIIKSAQARVVGEKIKVGTVSNSITDALLMEELGLHFISLGSDISRLTTMLT